MVDEIMTIEPNREERVAELAAQKALAAFAKSHPCRFTDHQAKMLHTISDENGGMDIETATLLIRVAKVINSTVNTVARGLVLALFAVLLFIMALVAHRNGWKLQ